MAGSRAVPSLRVMGEVGAMRQRARVLVALPRGARGPSPTGRQLSPQHGALGRPWAPRGLRPPVHPEHSQQPPGLGSWHVPPPSLLPVPLVCGHLSCSPLTVLCLSPRPPPVTLPTACQFPCFCVLRPLSPSLSLSPDPFLCLILVSSPVYFFLPLSRFPFLALSATSPSLTSPICDSLLLPNSPTDLTHPTCRALGPPAD